MIKRILLIIITIFTIIGIIVTADEIINDYKIERLKKHYNKIFNESKENK